VACSRARARGRLTSACSERALRINSSHVRGIGASLMRGVMRLVNTIAIVTLWALCACSAPSTPAAQLRVINSGKEPIENLTIVFPGSEVEFGSIPAGGTTAYKVVPRGVYAYAAYRYKVGRVEVTQPVRDFVGASPMGRARFSYRLEFDSSQTLRGVITLVDVTNDG